MRWKKGGRDDRRKMRHSSKAQTRIRPRTSARHASRIKIRSTQSRRIGTQSCISGVSFDGKGNQLKALLFLNFDQYSVIRNP